MVRPRKSYLTPWRSTPFSSQGQPAGWLYIDCRDDEIRIVDIALLPEYRGIGTTLLRGLQSEAAAAGKPLRIHVAHFNPALRLYERLRFRPIADRGVYLFMEWRGDNSQPLRLRAPKDYARATARPRQSFWRRFQGRAGNSQLQSESPEHR